jgi:hypothetical protein
MESFINGTISQVKKGDPFLSQLKQISSNSKDFRSYRDLKTNSQLAVGSIMKGLADFKKNETDKDGNSYREDSFQALIGAMSPHRDIRQVLYPEEYEYLIGNEPEEKKEKLTDFLNKRNKDISKRNDNITESNKNIRKRNIEYPDSKMDEFPKIEKIKVSGIKDMLRRNFGYSNIYERRLKDIHNLEKQKQDKIEKYRKIILKRNNFFGIEDWDMVSPLPYEVYNEKATSKAEDVLRGFDYKINKLKMGDEEKRNKLKEENKPVNITYLGINDIKAEIDKIRKEIDLFLDENNISKDQYRLAKTLWKKHNLKISSLLSIRSNIKLAQTGTVDDLILSLNHSFDDEFLKILNL